MMNPLVDSAITMAEASRNSTVAVREATTNGGNTLAVKMRLSLDLNQSDDCTGFFRCVL